jgi:hypothetical protein
MTWSLLKAKKKEAEMEQKSNSKMQSRGRRIQ